jgi:hypothetical protein
LVLFNFVFEGREEKWLKELIDVSDGQLHQNFQDIETFSRFYHQFYQHYVKSFIHFVLWLNLDVSPVLIIRDEAWGITDECALN